MKPEKKIKNESIWVLIYTKAKEEIKANENLKKHNGARGRTRTGTKFPSRDFKSLVSTNSTTRALTLLYSILIALVTLVIGG